MTPNANFQPMNANFGILSELEQQIKDKKTKYEYLSNRSLDIICKIKNNML